MRNTVTRADAAIHLDQVCKVFGKEGSEGAYRAVDGLDLDVRSGQMLALLGKTGCGKSTIFNMIAGLTEPTSGAVRVSGRDPFSGISFRFAAKWRSCSRTTDCCHGGRRSRTSNWGWRCWMCQQSSGGRRPSCG